MEQPKQYSKRLDSGEESRKKRQTKRDCTEVVEDLASDEGVVLNESKKLRASIPPSGVATNKKATGELLPDGSPQLLTHKEEQSSDHGKHETVTTTSLSSESATSRPVCEGISNSTTSTIFRFSTSGGQDLESALNYLVSIGEREKEFISNDSYISFRMGHAGDASTLADWYQNRNALEEDSDNAENSASKDDTNDKKRTEPIENKNDREGGKISQTDASGRVDVPEGAASTLELWLADGLGNEDIPPSLFALLAHVHTEEDCGQATGSHTKASRLAAAALLTLAWEDTLRVLCVEWFRVAPEMSHSDIVERRMWLRLSALSLIAACELRVLDKVAGYPD